MSAGSRRRQHLSDFAKTQAGWSDDFRRTWLRYQKQRLKDGRVLEVECVLVSLTSKEKEKAASELPYWSRNRHRLQYSKFRECGFPLGSGAVESAVRRVVNLRLKGASVAWTEEHAEGILHLRAYAKSGRWEEMEEAFFETTGWQPKVRRTRAA